MKSRLAADARIRLAGDLRRLSATERLQAFLTHCQLIAQLRPTQSRMRSGRSGARPLDAH